MDDQVCFFICINLSRKKKYKICTINKYFSINLSSKKYNLAYRFFVTFVRCITIFTRYKNFCHKLTRLFGYTRKCYNLYKFIHRYKRRIVRTVFLYYACSSYIVHTCRWSRIHYVPKVANSLKNRHDRDRDMLTEIY